MPKRRSFSRPALSVTNKHSAAGRGCLILFFSLFAAAGGGMLWFLTIRPFWGIIDGQSWVETPCTIVSSEVETHDGDDGDTYSIEIKYDYTFNGRKYRGERYHFMHGMSSSGRKGKQAVVDRYPAGLQTSCYVDPDDPTQAVLNRGLTADLWWGLFPLPFLAVGIGGLLFGTGIFGRRKTSTMMPADEQRALSSGSAATVDRDADDWWHHDEDLEPEGPVELKPNYTPLGKFAVITFACLFWNGIVSVFLYHVIDSHLNGRPEWCPTIFLIPFVLVGLLIIWGVFHSFLSLFIPRPTLTIDRARVPLGGTARLSWRFSGRAHIIRHLKVTLRGEESATYRRGTDTHTDKHTFLKEVLFETHDPLEIPQGEVDIRIPDDTMHSFASDNNKIVWEIHLDGEIPLRPDVDAEFPITVMPHEQYQRRHV